MSNKNINFDDNKLLQFNYNNTNKILYLEFINSVSNNIEYGYISVWNKINDKFNQEINDDSNEFYCSEININWLVCFITTNTVKNPETTKLVEECQDLLDVLLNVKGINLVDYTFYLLEDDLMFVDYNVKKQIFI